MNLSLRPLLLLSLTLLAPIAHARDPIAEECAKAEVDSVAHLLGEEAPAFVEASTAQQIAGEYNDDHHATWALAMYPTAKARLGGVLIQLGWIQDMRKSVDPSPQLPIDQYFEKTAQSKPVLSPSTKAFLKNEFRKWRKVFWFGSETRAFRSGTPYFCSYFELFKCIGPINRILTWMSPHVQGSWVVSMIDLWESVLNDTEYYPGLARAAGLVYQRIQGTRVHWDPRAAISDIYSDLVAGYRAVGKSEAEAQRRAIDILGIYGTRGASMVIAYSLARQETAQLIAPLTFISSAMSYLDALQPAGRYYSMPPSTTGTCLYGKPYHFWMAAYFVLALQADRTVPDAKTAAIASHIVGRVYESNSDTYGRDPDQAFVEPLLSPHNNRLRHNLAFNDAGVFWAAGRGTRPFNVNAAVELLKAEAKPLPLMTPEKLKELLKNPIERDRAWIRMFAPDVLIRQWLRREP